MFRAFILASILCAGFLMFSFPVVAQPQRAETDLDAEVTLNDLLKTAAENNPAIRSAAQSAAASRETAAAASALPDPTVKFETMGHLIPPELMPGDPSSVRGYGIEQEIPFPGKLGLKSDAASAEADAQQWNQEVVRRQVISDLKQAFYDLYLIRKSIDILLKNKELLQSFERTAESRYMVGQTSQQDVLKAQVEQSKILDKLLVLGEKKKIAEAKINNLLYRPSGNPIGKPAELHKAELKYSVEELTGLALNNAPSLKVQESEIARRQFGLELAQKEYYPDFAVGFTYYERDENPGMYRVMLSAKLPIWYYKQKHEVDAARLNLSSAKSQRDSASSTVRYQVKENYTTASTSEKLAKLYSSAIVPQANLALSSAIANYQVGKIDFLQLIDSSMALLEYELKYYEAMTDFHKALAQIEPIVGIDLTEG
jgi:outer membrane protein TolC